MEYNYWEIEAHIRRAEQLRSEALGLMIVSGWKKSTLWLKGLTQHLLHRNIVAARSSTHLVY